MSDGEMLVVASKVKGVLRDAEVNVGSGSVEALNGVVNWYIQQAALRAKANGRKTVQPHDFILMEAYGK